MQAQQSPGKSEPYASDFPTLRLTNRQATAVLCLPDCETGYYRGTRFDWSGIIHDLRIPGHRYVGEWQAKHDPLRHDGLTGPADEFTQIGYEHARLGQEFLKIGVGTLRRSSDRPYDRFQLYEIVNPGVRDVVSDHNRVEFRHRLMSDLYGYDYRKTLTLTDAPGLRIDYTLKNLGPSPLTGYVYNHNFFTLDRMAVGPETAIHFPFQPEGTWREEYDCARLTPDGIALSRNLNPGESVFMGDLHSQDPATQEYGFSLRNLRTGTGVRASGSGQLSYVVFWACPTVACLEPYIPFRVFPGETGVWHIDYELLK